MVDQVDARICALEDAHEIEKLVYLHVSHFDSFVGGRGAALDPSLYLRDFRWECAPFGSCDSFEAFTLFLEAYSRRISFSLQLLSPLGIDTDAHLSATGNWGVWQPFTLGGHPWILAGRYHNTFVREDIWRLAKMELQVDILVPWSAGWGDERISRTWNW